MGTAPATRYERTADGVATLGIAVRVGVHAGEVVGLGKAESRLAPSPAAAKEYVPSSMSGADAVLAHGLLNAVTVISAGASTLRSGRSDKRDVVCTILERQSEMVEAFIYGMTDTARKDLETPLWNVVALAAQVLDSTQHDPRGTEGLVSALADACEEAAAALRGFVRGFAPEVLAALDGLGQERRRTGGTRH